MNKIAILLFYFERPNMVRNALRSIVKADEHYKNWFLLAFDDGSENHLGPIVEEELSSIDYKPRTCVIRNEVTMEEKINSGGMLGFRQNQLMESAVNQLKVDAFIILCDDDELHPEYLKKLNEYFIANPNVLSCYSKVIFYNPLLETSDNVKSDQQNSSLAKLNSFDKPLNGFRKVDASQVAWRACCYTMGARFPFPTPKDQDAGLFESLAKNCGLMHPTGFVGQYKGVHPKQLGVVGAFNAWTKKDIDK
jgi:glycosyltransferase involved in cell wall biosynthesis